ncbi:hypothetical protein [Silvanigrella aquatica]|uniref:Outer membrane protein beta-barrel domain-containing protein n=1 Tax=Silvanigrella aquatica TaxID=1915309 RepID=A0A1L4D064_9BACT|nr:hypothetical protein [Silvanigrella aquatica]APJ03584.1 hypothetical protein AXG55_06550 [Silvanigrella aquatica]
MKIKVFLSVLSACFMASNVYAEETKVTNNNQNSESDFDVIISGGYSSLTGFQKANDYAFQIPNMTGYNLGVDFYTSFGSGLIAPVVGGGANFLYASGRNEPSNNQYLNLAIGDLSAVIRGGAKFNLSKDFELVTVVNLGISMIQYYNKKALNTSDVDADYLSCCYFGFTAVGSYRIAEDISIGAGYTFNQRYFSVKSKYDDYDKLISAQENSINAIIEFKL